MSGMLWIALKLSIPKIGFNIMLFLTVKKVDVFKFDGVAESDNTAQWSQDKSLCVATRLPLSVRSLRFAGDSLAI